MASDQSADNTPQSVADRKELLEEQKGNLLIASRVLMCWLIFGCIVILIYSIKGPTQFDGFRALAVFTNGMQVAFASVSVGVIIGFLFGIPRTLQHDSAGDSNYGQKVNTNLEQISDWLTKILVGVGLTQLAKVPEKLEALATYFGPGVGDNGAFALAIILNFSVTGFIMGYILTRLFLSKAFYVVDSSNDSRIRIMQTQINAQAQISSENQDTIKAVAYTVIKDIASDPTQADRRSDPATQKIMQVASEKVLDEPPENRSVEDWLIAVNAALQNGKYEDAVSLANKTIESNPPKKALWGVYNLLGLAYHYQQPDNWKKGDPESWFNSALESYGLAIENANSEAEKMLSRANRAYLYLDTGRYDECQSEVEDILSKEKLINPGSSVYDLVRLVGAALKALQEKPSEAALLLNGVKDLPRWRYLFEGKDISEDVVTAFLKIPDIKPEYLEFLKQFKS